MKFSSEFKFDFKDDNELFFKLISEEDFDFKNKDISIDIEFSGDFLKVIIFTNSLLDFKIAISSLIKSFEVIEKSLKC